jgi:photosystem II cytochrome c550
MRRRNDISTQADLSISSTKTNAATLLTVLISIALSIGVDINSLFSNVYGVRNAWAESFSKEIRTVKADSIGGSSILTLDNYKRGRRLFNNACAPCHVGGITKTNFNVGLDTLAMGIAIPPRDNVQGIVEYLENPVTLDGREKLDETHPNTGNADLFPKMRNLSDLDLQYIAGYILIQSLVQREKWGGGKVFY